MKHKKGIELSVNFLVVIIISLAMLGMAVVFFNKFFAGAKTIQASYDKQTEEELESLLVQGKKVAIPFTREEIRAGETAVFGLGILNVAGGEREFFIEIECDKFIRDDGSTAGCPSVEDPLFPSSKILKNNEHLKVPIAIPTKKSAQLGTYVYNLCVCDGNSCSGCPPWDLTKLYDGSSHKIYVKIK